MVQIMVHKLWSMRLNRLQFLLSPYAAEKRMSERMAVSISQQKNDLKKDVDQTRRFLANSHRRRSTYELLIPNEDGNTVCTHQNHATKSCSPNNLGRISEKIPKLLVFKTVSIRKDRLLWT